MHGGSKKKKVWIRHLCTTPYLNGLKFIHLYTHNGLSEELSFHNLWQNIFYTVWHACDLRHLMFCKRIWIFFQTRQILSSSSSSLHGFECLSLILFLFYRYLIVIFTNRMLRIHFYLFKTFIYNEHSRRFQLSFLFFF